uniref:Uncharacterized protein n=1 Tax=Rhizophora mucronata TaxID=61149 RepID=A0A2P2PEX3_RHIMU
MQELSLSTSSSTSFPRSSGSAESL